MIYIFSIMLGGFNLYLWLQIQSLKKTANRTSDSLISIINFLQPSKPHEELKPYELRTIVSQNKISIIKIEEKLNRVEVIALQALDNVGSIIRHSKTHPITKDTINTFITEQGLLNDESSPKNN